MSKVKEPPVEKASTSKKQKLANNKKIGGIVAGVVIVLAILAAAYYFFVRQNPTNVVFDSVVNALQAKNATANGTIHYKIDRLSSTVDVTLDATKADKDSATNAKVTYTYPNAKKPLVVDAKAIIAKNGDAYIKLQNADGLLQTVFDELARLQAKTQAATAPTPSFSFAPLIVNIGKSLNNRWIKLPATSSESTTDNVFTCVQGALSDLNQNNTTRQEVVDAYKDNDFLSIDKSLQAEGNSDGYKVTVDNTKFTAFKKATEQSKFGKKIAACTKDTAKQTGSGSTVDSKVSSVDMWIDRYNHSLTHVKSATDDKEQSIDMKFDFGAKTKVDIPTDAKTLSELFDANQPGAHPAS